MDWIDHKNQILSGEDRLLIPVVLMRAILLAVQEHPKMNGYYENEKFVQKESINLGVAISLKSGGVMVPAIMNAETMSTSKLNTHFQDLLIRTRKGELKNRELTEGTITITNVGDLGSDDVLGIIFPPQVALIGIGRIHKEAVVNDGEVKPGFVIYLTLSADHRVTDGLAGARFLASIERNLMNPNLLEDVDERIGNQVPPERNLSSGSTGDFV
jgi:pyruvate dehydrogenase E2 component (dihydrolipoamide acetyltransferase)